MTLQHVDRVVHPGGGGIAPGVPTTVCSTCGARQATEDARLIHTQKTGHTRFEPAAPIAIGQR